MGGVVKAIVGVVGIAAMFIPGVGTAIGAALTFSGLGVGVATAIGYGIMAAGIGLAVSTVSKIAGLGPKSPKITSSTSDRLSANINPRAYRGSVVGLTAMHTDIAYQEFTGTDQEFYNQIITCASHPVQSIDEIWFDDELAWSATGGVASKFAGYLTVTTRLEGTTANALTITGSSSWNAASSRLVGCAYVWLRYKLTGNSKKAESPFSGGITSRITIKGRGAKLYDPRLDSTVGGSGSHRADNQATWAWVSDDVGRNPALQLLWFLLGYRITNPVTFAQRLAVGAGLPAARIDLDSFITAANMCDEPVSLAAGGTEPRYRADGVWNEGDDPKTVQDALLAAMNGVLRDAGGKLRLEILHNDLATPVVTLTHADVVGEFQWIQTPAIDQTFNCVRGQYVDASSLYQLVDYPDVRIESPDGIERDQQFDCPMVQSASQAQRLAKSFLQRAQYPGTFSAEFLASAWRCEVGSLIRFTFPALGFAAKPFRVVEHSIQFNGLCRMVLREENAAIYAWDAEEATAVVAAAPITYDPLKNPLVLGISEVLAETSRHEPADTSTVFTANFAATLDAGQLPRNIQFRRVSAGIDVSADATWSVVSQGAITGGTVTVANGVVTIPSGVTVPLSTSIVVQSVLDGVQIRSSISVSRMDSSTPSGGTGGGTAVTDSIFDTVSGTALTAISDLMTVKTGTAGQLSFSAPLSIFAELASPDGQFGAVAQWRYRPIGGSFSNAGAQASSTASANVFYDPDLDVYFATAGAINAAATVTGLTASTEYEVQLFAARVSSSPTKVISFGGTASVIGS